MQPYYLSCLFLFHRLELKLPPNAYILTNFFLGCWANCCAVLQSCFTSNTGPFEKPAAVSGWNVDALCEQHREGRRGDEGECLYSDRE